MYSIRKNLTTGLLSAIPLWVTWLVIAFVLGLAVDVTRPLISWLMDEFRPLFPGAAEILGLSAVQHAISVLFLLIILYCLGWLTTHFAGRYLIKIIDKILQKIPFVGKIYHGTKQVIDAFQVKPGQTKQVVLIEYPHPGMKTVGLVTKALTDRVSQKSLLAVYVPTTPNPTSGFLEIIPKESVIHTDWTVNDAIAFIVSGGSIGPDIVDYSQNSIQSENEMEK
ncbi:MAG: DUF502 domain-containing protein [Candidatus Zixiibacteriota bacterium]